MNVIGELLSWATTGCLWAMLGCLLAAPVLRHLAATNRRQPGIGYFQASQLFFTQALWYTPRGLYYRQLHWLSWCGAVGFLALAMLLSQWAEP